MQNFLKRLARDVARDERGTATIEYALVAGLIIIASISLIGVFGTKVLARWNSVNSAAL